MQHLSPLHELHLHNTVTNSPPSVHIYVNILHHMNINCNHRREVSIECTLYLTYIFSCWGLAVSYDEAVPLFHQYILQLSLSGESDMEGGNRPMHRSGGGGIECSAPL
jgi:hypothetical protein